MSATHYDPKNIEENYYPIWENRGYFEIDGNKSIAKPDKHFAIMMPPPNVTDGFISDTVSPSPSKISSSATNGWTVI